jgi:hypothetical protein
MMILVFIMFYNYYLSMIMSIIWNAFDDDYDYSVVKKEWLLNHDLILWLLIMGRIVDWWLFGDACRILHLAPPFLMLGPVS